MTAADFAMKRAFDEMARRGHASVVPATPHVTARPTRSNVAGYELPPSQSPINIHRSPSSPTGRRVSLQRYHQLQHSIALSSISDVDYKRVGRKSSRTFPSSPSTSFVPPTTSSSPFEVSSQTSSTPNFSPPPYYSFLHPLATESPSLSSSVDTIDTSPTETPTYGDFSDFDFDFASASAELAEPIRTKRKFPLYKPAKRLPHHHHRSSGEREEVWEVHAWIVDLGGVAGPVEEGRQAVESGAPDRSQKKGRSVRFEGIPEPDTIDGFEEERSSRLDPSFSSSFSLSKYRFPEPPGALHTVESVPTPPNSPATLYFNGASFNLVNPHESLQLGASQIETPAEIDGLLDDYFRNSDDVIMQPYDDITGELSSSQQSISSNGRQRILYDDPQEARQRILGAAPSPGSASPFQRSAFSKDDSNDIPPPLQLRPSAQRLASRFREDLPSTEEQAPQVGSSSATATIEQTLQGLGLVENEEDVRNTSDSDTGRALSQRSDPFNLTIDDLIKDQGTRNIDEVIDDDDGAPDKEDGADADANADASNNGLETETTVSNILNAYTYTRPPLPGSEFEEFTLRDSTSTSQPSSVELPRGYKSNDDVFQAQHESIPAPPPTPRLRVAELASPRMRGPPGVPPPRPPRPTLNQTPSYQDYATFQSDYTYGSTRQLLNLTPQVATFSSSPYQTSRSTPRRSMSDHVRDRIPPEVPEESPDQLEEDPVSTYPAAGKGPAGFIIPQTVQRSSSVYTNESDDDWATEPSESRANLAENDGQPHIRKGVDLKRCSSSSYANTSVVASNHRLSLPRPVSAALASSKNLLDTISKKVTGKAAQDNEDVEGGIIEITPSALDHIRDQSQRAYRGTVDRVVDKLSKMSNLTPLKPIYSPQKNSSTANLLGHHPEAHHSTSSDRAGLLSHQSPYTMSGALAFSETANTFQTTPRTPGAAISPYSPTTPTSLASPLSALIRQRSETAPIRHGPQQGDAIEMQRFRPKKRSTAAMSGQKNLQPLTLVCSNTTPGGKTDRQLRDAEPGWTNEPDFSSSGPLSKHIHPVRGATWGIEQKDGTVERVSLLLRPAEARNLALGRKQKEITRPYYLLCVLCPVSALVFGLGGMDWKMRRVSKGKIREMDREMKLRARTIFLALGMMLYALVAVVVVLVVKIE